MHFQRTRRPHATRPRPLGTLVQAPVDCRRSSLKSCPGYRSRRTGSIPWPDLLPWLCFRFYLSNWSLRHDRATSFWLLRAGQHVPRTNVISLTRRQSICAWSGPCPSPHPGATLGIWKIGSNSSEISCGTIFYVWYNLVMALDLAESRATKVASDAVPWMTPPPLPVGENKKSSGKFSILPSQFIVT